ncbi:tryptophan-rich sensory protein [Aureisphaera galaxeae]|uniref:TspO/MBR family protein n=1 Tax=Aureisphaera galaxeae TaxID=1538023 RepID=UPI0023502250|nr:TspO/MBR family protein [Aureisphaera galaxeae]MDC8003673.1 tryptophan-rich sensory protein [Aureisphaera galaxeae]
MIYRIIAFLIVNFAALGISSYFTGIGVPGDWYINLNKAPWTPPGWVFGAAWSTIMICFSIYMAYGWGMVSNRKRLATLFVVQWFLNVAWSPVFFFYQNTQLGFVVIASLAIVVGYMLFSYGRKFKSYSYLLLPYFLWLVLASSLNGYILFNN